MTQDTFGQGAEAEEEENLDMSNVMPSEERALVPYDPLQLYLYEIKKYNLLTKEEETELAIRVKEDNDEEAAYRLITSNSHGFSQVLDKKPA